MFAKHLLLPLALSVALLMTAVDSVQAQRGGHGGGGGGGPRGGPIGGGPRGGPVAGGYRGGPGYGYGYGHGGYGYGFGRGPYYRFGYGFGWPYYYGYYPFVGFGFGLGLYAPFYGYAYDLYGSQAYGAVPPSIAGAATSPPPSNIPSDAASIRVLVPEVDTPLFFDGNKTSQTGKERYFHTPPLSAGVNASYRIRAIVRLAGRDVTLEQVVPVGPGQNITVDFTRPPAEPLAPPAGKQE